MTSIGVVVPNLNGARFLPTCLDSLRQQTRQPSEVVVVDDGSSDESRALLSSSYPDVRIVAHSCTLGVARGFNDGIRAMASSIVVLLNNDTEVEPDWLEQLIRPLEEDPGISMTTSKLLLFDRRHVLHSAGDSFGRDGMPGNRGVWQEDRGQFDRDLEPFGACGAAAAYRRSLFEEIGLFDEALGSYCEDVDLNFRARLAGHRCRFVPGARVYHRVSATGGGPTSSFYVGRNVIWVLAKNLPTALLRKYWPKILARQFSIARESLWHWREPAARARVRGQIEGLRYIGQPLASRAEIQRRRRISIAALDAFLT